MSAGGDNLNIKKFEIQEMDLNSKVAIIGKPGCFGRGTMVMKADGSTKAVEDVMPHETLMGDDGGIRRVLELRRGTENMYRITVLGCDSEAIVVNETHDLVLCDVRNDEIMEINVRDYLALDELERGFLQWFRSPVRTFHRYVTPISDTRAWRFGREVSTGVLESIPEAVRFGSFRVRQQFIRGLLTFHPDYMASRNVGTVCFEGGGGSDRRSSHLLRDVVFIARSIGYECTHVKEDAFTIDFRACALGYLMSTSFACEALPEPEEYYGFTLDGNHRFLLEDFSVVRNTGKSTLMKDLLYQHRDRFPIGMVLSETNKESGDFDGLVPPLFTYDYYNQQAMDKLVLRQKRMVRKNGEGNEKNYAFVVVDDCMDDTSWVNHVTTKGIFKNGRHWDLFFVLSMQYCLGIPPTLRTCLDYIFILREPNLRNRKQLWINYASIFPFFEMFCDALDDLTQNYHCMVIKNRVLSNKIEDVVFWYKAKRHKPFRVGKADWWAWAERNYNAQYEEEEEEELLQRGGKKNGDTNKNQLYGHSRRRGGVRLRVRMEN